MQGEVYEAHEVAVVVVGWEEAGGRRAVVGRAADHCVEQALHRCWACLVSACQTHGSWNGMGGHAWGGGGASVSRQVCR